jgi:RNA polymerase sigma factor for flagellar operon FliA
LWPAQKNAALIGLWEAAKKYDPSRGYKFKTYAFLRIIGAMQDENRSDEHIRSRSPYYRRDGNPVPQVVHISALSTDDENNPFAWIGDDGKPPDWINREWLLSLLPCGQLRDVCERYYFDGFTMREIGEQLGVSESRVCQLVNAGVKAARRRANRDLLPPPADGKKDKGIMDDQDDDKDGKTNKHYFAAEKREIVEKIVADKAANRIVSFEEGARKAGIDTAKFYKWKKQFAIADAPAVKKPEPTGTKFFSIQDAIQLIKEQGEGCIVAVAHEDALYVAVTGDQATYQTLQELVASKARKQFGNPVVTLPVFTAPPHNPPIVNLSAGGEGR